MIRKFITLLLALGLIGLGAFFITHWWTFRSVAGGAVLVFAGCAIIWKYFISKERPQ